MFRLIGIEVLELVVICMALYFIYRIVKAILKKEREICDKEEKRK